MLRTNQFANTQLLKPALGDIIVPASSPAPHRSLRRVLCLGRIGDEMNSPEAIRAKRYEDMSASSSQTIQYRDSRQDFFREFFQRALPYDAYLLASNPAHAARWKEREKQISLSTAQKKLLASFTRKLNVLVLSGAWCGDCSRQGPMIRAIADACPHMDLRFLDNRLNPELQNELRINGAEKVPVVVVLSEDFFELQRYGDRHLSVYRRKGSLELGAACDPGLLPAPNFELQTELEEWINFFERIHWMVRLAPALRKRYND